MDTIQEFGQVNIISTENEEWITLLSKTKKEASNRNV